MFYSIINRSQFNLTKERRIDSDYFSPYSLEIEKLFLAQSSNKLKFLCEKITDFGAYSQMNFVHYLSNGFARFIRNQDVNGVSIKNEKPIFISKEVYNKLSLHLAENDIVVQRTGSIGKAGIIQASDLPSTANQNLAQIRVNQEKINPYYLIAFFNGKYGINSFHRLQTGNVQPWLNLRQIGDILIPTIDYKFQLEIEALMKKGLENENKSQTLYQQATTLLEKELGLDKITFDNPKSYTASFSEVVKDGRISSYFFEPKFKQLDSLINNFETTPLRALINNYSTGFAFAKKHLTKEKTDAPLIKIANIKLMDIDIESSDFVNALGKEAGSSEIVKKDDILIGMSGSVGTSAVIRENTYAFINQRILRINSLGKVDPEYLALVINSKIGKMQFEKYGTGGVQVNISPRDMLNIKIPRLGEIENTISELIKKSFEAKKESKQLLEQAKNRVEELIEVAAKK